MLNGFLESLYSKVLINIVIKRSTCEVYIEVCSKKGTISSTQQTFETTTLNESMLELITKYIKESPYYYISVLDTSSQQGAIPTCDREKLSHYKDLTTSEHKCYNSWSYYTSKSDLYAIEKTFSEIGVDFIFSPFLILLHFFKDKINSKLAMYVLVQENSLSLAIFEEGELLFAHRLGMNVLEEDDGEDMLHHGMHEDDDDISLGEDLSIDLEDVDVIDDIESLDDFGDIEDLDSLDDIDEFSENQDIEEELLEVEEEPHEEVEHNFNEDYQRFTLIQASLGHFYNDAKYESKFIESVYIADGVSVSPDLKRFLEEEMFLNVYIRQLNIGMELAEITKMELGL